MTADELEAAVGKFAGDALLASAGERASLTLWLPYRHSALLSPTFRSATEAEDAAGPAIRSAAVPTLSFAPLDAIDLLLDFDADRSGRSGDSLAYWSGLARLVLSLLARRQFVPDIEVAADDCHAARWRALVDDPAELAWLERYAAAMPLVCRAVSTEAAAETEPARIVDSFVSETLDAVVQRMLANDPFFRQIQRRVSRQPEPELRWLSALLSENRVLRGDPDENAALAEEIQAWVGQLHDDVTPPTPKLCFALHEPEGEGDSPDAPWCVKLGFRFGEGQDMLALTTLRADPRASPSILGRRLAGRRQRLLAELRRAAEVFPDLESVLHGRTANAISLTTAEAHAFLRQWAPLLKARDFEVTLPDWAAESERQVGLTLLLRPAEEHADRPREDRGEISVGSFGLNTLLDFDWRIAVGDERLSPEEFERLAARRAPLMKIRGVWVDIDWDAAETALKFLRRRPAGKITLAEAIRMAGGTEDVDTGLPILGLSGTSWLEQLLAQSPEAAIEGLPQPESFDGTLRPYQRRGLNWLAFLDRLGVGACLADDMGLGKTIQLIALLLHERERRAAGGAVGQLIGPTLLFAPMSVVGNWEREVYRFAPSLRVLVHHGPDRLLGDGFVAAAMRHDLVVTTYGLAQRDLQGFSRVPWHRVVLDEAQKIKNPNANQTIAIRAIRAARRVALTGTPVENHLSELWSIMEMLNPGLLASAAAFRARFAVPVEKMGDQQRAGQLRRMIRPFVLRRLKSDPAVACDLPEKMEMRVYCNLTPEQAGYYERLVAEMLKEVDSAVGIQRRGLILATITKLKQVCNHPEHLLRGKGPLDRRSGKCERLVEMLEELLDEGDAALVFTQYREMGHILERFLSDRLGAELLFMHGGTPAKRREEMVQRFQDPNAPVRIFLLSLKTGGFGLNLTRANHVFHFDRWWNPAVEDQATDRAHRIGQTRRVQVHKFVCIGTIEDRIDQVLAEKSALADHIIGGGDDWLTGLSTRELREYLALSSDAVAEE